MILNRFKSLTYLGLCFIGLLGFGTCQLFVSSIVFREPEIPVQRLGGPDLITRIHVVKTLPPTTPGTGVRPPSTPRASTPTAPTPSTAAPPCIGPSRCLNLCPYGFATDNNNCNRCECRNRSCQLECPAGKVCYIKSPPCDEDTCQETTVCSKPAGICHTLPAKQDSACGLAHIRFIYNVFSGRCEISIDNGCDRWVKNRFKTQEECELICQAGDVQLLKPKCAEECPFGYEKTTNDGVAQYSCECIAKDPCDTGNCKRRRTCRLGYPKCAKGFYCNPIALCLSELRTRSDCEESLDRGLETCSGTIPRYYYDAGCHEFSYSGCGGNRNNFFSFEECERICTAKITEPTKLPTPKPTRAKLTKKPTTPGPTCPPKVPCPEDCDYGYLRQTENKCPICVCQPNACLKKKCDKAKEICYAVQDGIAKGEANITFICKDPSHICILPSNRTLSKSLCKKKKKMRDRFYYDKYTDRCHKFRVDICKRRGNQNIFISKINCEQMCIEPMFSWEKKYELGAGLKANHQTCAATSYNHCPYGHVVDTSRPRNNLPNCITNKCKEDPCSNRTACSGTTLDCRTKPQPQCNSEATKECVHDIQCKDTNTCSASNAAILKSNPKCKNKRSFYLRYTFKAAKKECVSFQMCTTANETRSVNSFEIKEECEKVCNSDL